MAYGGSVAACGLAGGNGLSTTVIPFLLRGVNLLGIDSVLCPSDHRARVWGRVAEVLATGDLAQRFDAMTSETNLSGVAALAPEILAGQVKGRVVVAAQA
jgi:acrylyl-CoA reductase (NADPH)